jgi:fatty acid desaturase
MMRFPEPCHQFCDFSEWICSWFKNLMWKFNCQFGSLNRSEREKQRCKNWSEFYFILFYFILFYFLLFYFILFYFILFYFIFFYFIFFLFFSFLSCDERMSGWTDERMNGYGSSVAPINRSVKVHHKLSPFEFA